MVQTKRQIERRIAEACAFGIQELRPSASEKDVLRADVAVHDAHLRARRLLGEILQNRREVGVDPRRGQKVRLEPERMKRRTGVEVGGRCWGFRKRGVH